MKELLRRRLLYCLAFHDWAHSGVDPESYIHSKYIVIWACNSVSTNLHHWAIVQDAKKKGAKVVAIDSYKSRTAKQADWHLSPKPN